MILLIVSFIAGVLTTLAPCALPLLPVIVGGSLSGQSRKYKALVVVSSLALSIIAFTLLLKATSVFIAVPEYFWKTLSSVIVIGFGLSMLFPKTFEKIYLKANLILGRKSNQLVAEGVQKESFKGDILIGASLGPVFASCSPTYFLILATVLPESFLKGLVYLFAYATGLSLTLLLIAKLGEKLVVKLEKYADPEGLFKKSLGVIFVIVGVLIATGVDKKIEGVLVRNNILNFVSLEQKILQKSVEEEKVLPGVGEEEKSSVLEETVGGSKVFNLEQTLSEKKRKYLKAEEIVAPSGYINASPFSLKDYIGKKVILIDFVTYSCINCQRTFPFLNAWYKEYEDDGLLIVGIHTPEFAFEKNIENVKKALDGFGIKFPVVLDNDYGTWKAYKNVYWPRKYLIDIDGFVVYDHIGEGKYEETEKKIQELLAEKKSRLGEELKFGDAVSKTIVEEKIESASPEIYFGSMRNENLGNGLAYIFGPKEFVVPSERKSNTLYLGGKWEIKPEYAESQGTTEVYFKYSAKKMFMVASSENSVEIGVYENGKFFKNIKVKDSQLYTLLENQSKESGEVMLKIPSGVKVFTFTFG